MRYLTEFQCREWARANAPMLLHPFQRPDGLGFGSLETLPPARLYGVVRSLIARAAVAGSTSRETLVWVHEHGIWPSSEQLFLYTLLRRAHADHGAIETTPGHVAGPDEAEDLVATVFLALMYGWGIAIASAGSSHAVCIDHDGIAWTTDAAGVITLIPDDELITG